MPTSVSRIGSDRHQKKWSSRHYQRDMSRPSFAPTLCPKVNAGSSTVTRLVMLVTLIDLEGPERHVALKRNAMERIAHSSFTRGIDRKSWSQRTGSRLFSGSRNRVAVSTTSVIPVILRD